jgi:WD40 repeat protein
MMREAERPITRELVRIQDFPQGLWAVQVAPAPHDDRFVACGNAGRVAIHEVGGRLVHDLTVDVGRPLSFDRCTFDATAARVVAVSREGIARAWDATTGAVLWTIDRGATPVKDTWTNQAATFAVEGERVVVCRKQRSAEVWDLSTGAVLFEKAFALDTYCGLVGDRLFVGTLGTLDEYELTNTERVRNIYTSPPGDDPVYAFGSIHDAQRQRLYYVVDRRVFIWDLSTHALIASLPHASGVSTLTLSHDGRLLATAGTDGQITVWNAHTGELRREHTSPSGQRVRVEHVAFDPAGHHLIATFADNILRVYDVMTGELEVAHPVTYNAGAGPSAPAVPISSHAARGHDGTPFGRVVSHVGAEVIVWRPSRGALTQDIRPKQHTYAGVVAPDGEHLLVTGASFAEVRTSSSGEVVKALSTASEVRFWGADWSRSGVLAIAGERATAELFDAASGRSLGRLEGHEGTINSIAFSPDGLTIATAGEDRSLRVWDVATRREVARLPHDSRVMSVAWSRDGMALVSAEFAGVLRVWDVGAQAVTTTVREPALRFLSVEFTHDDQAIIGGARESVAATWDRHTGQRLVTFEGHSAQVTWVGESPDGALVATVSVDQSVRLWDAHTGVELGRRKHLTEIVEGTWHRDQVISFGNEAFVRFWDASRFEGTLVDAETLMQRTPWRLVDGRVQRLRRDP